MKTKRTYGVVLPIFAILCATQTLYADKNTHGAVNAAAQASSAASLREQQNGAGTPFGTIMLVEKPTVNLTASGSFPDYKNMRLNLSTNLCALKNGSGSAVQNFHSTVMYSEDFCFIELRIPITFNTPFAKPPVILSNVRFGEAPLYVAADGHIANIISTTACAAHVTRNACEIQLLLLLDIDDLTTVSRLIEELLAHMEIDFFALSPDVSLEHVETNNITSHFDEYGLDIENASYTIDAAHDRSGTFVYLTVDLLGHIKSTSSKQPLFFVHASVPGPHKLIAGKTVLLGTHTEAASVSDTQQRLRIVYTLYTWEHNADELQQLTHHLLNTCCVTCVGLVADTTRNDKLPQETNPRASNKALASSTGITHTMTGTLYLNASTTDAHTPTSPKLKVQAQHNEIEFFKEPTVTYETLPTAVLDIPGYTATWADIKIANHLGVFIIQTDLIITQSLPRSGSDSGVASDSHSANKKIIFVFPILRHQKTLSDCAIHGTFPDDAVLENLVVYAQPETNTSTRVSIVITAGTTETELTELTALLNQIIESLELTVLIQEIQSFSVLD